MRYQIDSDVFDAKENAKNKLIRCNQLERTIIDSFISAYEDFWGISERGSRHTTEEMQLILDAMPQSIAIDVLNDAAGLRDFIANFYGGGLDAKYQSPAFEINVVGGRLVVGDLKEVWKPVTE